MATASAASAGPLSVRTLYRSFLRETQRQNATKRLAIVRRDDPLPRYVRKLARGEIGAVGGRADGSTVEPLRQRLDNIATLLYQTRIHGELLARYNPVYGKSEQERIKATANRVGLDVPKEYEDAVREAERRGRPSIDEKYR